MARKRKPLPPHDNVFIRKHEEQLVKDFFARENLPMIDLDRLPKLHSSKPSPASTPSAARLDSMASRAQYRKTQSFIARKEQQRRDKRKAQDE